MNFDKFWNYWLCRIKEKFTGTIQAEFDKGVLVSLRRNLKEDIEQFK